MRVFIDSDILIWHLRGRIEAKEFLDSQFKDIHLDLWLGALQRAEIVFFMRPEEEQSTLLLLSQFSTAPIDQDTVDQAGVIYRKWNPSHGTDINDAFLAATIRQTGGCLYTLNTKHYPMDDIHLKKAWETQ